MACLGNLTKHRMFRFFLLLLVQGWCRVFEVIEISYGPLLVLSLSLFFSRALIHVRASVHIYMCKSIYALEYKHKKRSYFVKLCARNPIQM